MEHEILRNEHIDLLKAHNSDLVKHDRFLESYIQLLGYNTTLRLAIANIPSDTKKKSKSTKSEKETEQAIRKAKRIANREPVPTLPNGRKRKALSNQPAKPKRAYTKRKLAASSETIKPAKVKKLDASELDDSDYSSESGSSSSSSDNSVTLSSSSSSYGEEVAENEVKSTVTITDSF